MAAPPASPHTLVLRCSKRPALRNSKIEKRKTPNEQRRSLLNIPRLEGVEVEGMLATLASEFGVCNRRCKVQKLPLSEVGKQYHHGDKIQKAPRSGSRALIRRLRPWS
jgi:hypothetical protein